MSTLIEFTGTRAFRLGLKILAGAVVVALVAAGGWLWYRHQDARGQLALAEVADMVRQAESPAAAPDVRDKAIKALEAVIAEQSRSSIVPQAAYQLGNLRYTAAEYGAARAAYEVALAKGASGAIRTLTAVAIGYAWEAEKSYVNAAAAYEASLRGLGPKDFYYEQVLMDLARAQELAGKPSEAVASYQRLLKDLPDARRAQDLRVRIAGLQSQSGK